MEIRYFTSPDGENPTLEFIGGLPAETRAYIQADIAEIGAHPDGPAVAWRWITGYTPMREIKTGGYRTFFFVEIGVIWIVGCCKKQDQRKAIKIAAGRMKSLRIEIAEYVRRSKTSSPKQEQQEKKARKPS